MMMMMMIVSAVERAHDTPTGNHNAEQRLGPRSGRYSAWAIYAIPRQSFRQFDKLDHAHIRYIPNIGQHRAADDEF